ncbi:MAG: hypothetical protein OEY55_08255 [Acidimicrobiia bacterium]|nr:hypothetical protein [Acidimicrobiia bacterium]MDH5503522.1 hypothetical protein [Acidimicrobiia bacterium]
MDLVPWLSALGFGSLGWAIGRATNNWNAPDRATARHVMVRRNAQVAGLAGIYWVTAWQVLARLDLFDLGSVPVVVLFLAPLSGVGYGLAVRQHALSLFGRRLPRRLRPRMFVRR